MRGRHRGQSVLGNPREGVLSGLNFRRHKYSLKLENPYYGALMSPEKTPSLRTQNNRCPKKLKFLILEWSASIVYCQQCFIQRYVLEYLELRNLLALKTRRRFLQVIFNAFPKLEQFLLETIESSANEMISNTNKLWKCRKVAARCINIAQIDCDEALIDSAYLAEKWRKGRYTQLKHLFWNDQDR